MYHLIHKLFLAAPLPSMTSIASFPWMVKITLFTYLQLDLTLLMESTHRHQFEPAPENQPQGLNNFSRMVQNLYVKANLAEKEQVFILIFPFFPQYVVDRYNHYILERILESGTTDQNIKKGPNHHQLMILELLVRCQCVLVFDTYGCKVLQKAVEVVHTSLCLRSLHDRFHSTWTKLVRLFTLTSLC